ncbi:MAG: 1-acyl-sn-glycerol-3-phosphate acyltransferase [Desulfomonile tiedjei]|uniref:1-acyl-sn-glycerol-3-phosphate acyltransferase n=1 Tax=Desulfomonile tiedjei TaxID=2358 RepID=A0A9D6Z639_9BACT|nr:1-acyl-sn-glycerol-3-phosphate acyltransferase [Desulfomonile tiedjei]
MRFQIRLLPRQLFAGAGTVLTTVVLAPLIMLRSMFPRSAYATYRMGRMWNWAVAKFMGLTFSISGAEKIVPGSSYIIAPNHQSFADILALFVNLPTPFRWVIKKELLKIPLFGKALGATGAICLDRSDKERSVKSLQEGTNKLGEGWSVLIYPEGTRTPDGLLHAFKKGAFMMAVQTGVSILPVTCNGAFKVMPKNTLLFRPGHITLSIGDPILTKGLTESSVPQLMERTWQAINKHLNPAYDPFQRNLLDT